MKLQTPAELARLVKNARTQRELTQQDVADAVSITRQSLARLERGNGGTSFDTVLLILDHLGIHLDATVERRTTAPATVTTGDAAQAAADALAKRTAPFIGSSAPTSLREASRRLTDGLTVPGSVLLTPPQAVEAGLAAAAEPETDANLDTAEDAE